MTLPTLTKIRFRNGIWEGLLAGPARPEVQVTHLDQPLDGVTVEETSRTGEWTLRIPVPPEVIADGVQTVLIADASGALLGYFTLIAGETTADDLRAEVDLLRAELDMLKRAFRRHCVETA